MMASHADFSYDINNALRRYCAPLIDVAASYCQADDGAGSHLIVESAGHLHQFRLPALGATIVDAYRIIDEITHRNGD